MTLLLTLHSSASHLRQRAPVLFRQSRLIDETKLRLFTSRKYLFETCQIGRRPFSSSAPRTSPFTTRGKQSILCRDSSIRSVPQTRPFHKTSRNDALPPMIPLLKLVASALAKSKIYLKFGGFLTKVFQPLFIKLAKSKFAKTLAAVSKQFHRSPAAMAVIGRVARKTGLREDKIASLIFFLTIYSIFTIFYHLKTRKVSETGRKQHITNINEQRTILIAKVEVHRQLTQFKDIILDPNDKSSRWIDSITKRIVNSNKDEDFMKRFEWFTWVVNNDEFNAMANATGDILVFKKLIDGMEIEDQVASILAHEIAHLSRHHSVEKYGLLDYADSFVGFTSFAIGMFFRYWVAAILFLVSYFVLQAVFTYGWHLPYSRAMEIEADIVSLKYLAKAGYDVRQASNALRIMHIHELMTGDTETLELLSSHPATDERIEIIEELTPLAIELREACGHPPLPKKDPRIFNRQQHAEAKNMAAQRKQKTMAESNAKDVEDLKDTEGRKERQQMMENGKVAFEREIQRVKEMSELKRKKKLDASHVKALTS